VEPTEFSGPAAVFWRGDRDGNGVIDAADAPPGYTPPDLSDAARRWR